MRICCWNVRRASRTSAAWELFRELSPDVALLQEVQGMPPEISQAYQVTMHRSAGSKHGTYQRFNAAILVRGTVGPPIPLSTRWDWVNRELEHFRGNLVAQEILVGGNRYRAMSVYSPAWPVDPERLQGVDVAPVKLTQNPKVWVTELLWAALSEASASEDVAWIVGGDLNASVTFDYMWGAKPRGNQEILDRMQSLGLRECLRQFHGCLVPTFRSPRGGQVVHQMDHLFVSKSLADDLTSCVTGDARRVFGDSLSDHLPIIADFS